MSLLNSILNSSILIPEDAQEAQEFVGTIGTGDDGGNDAIDFPPFPERLPPPRSSINPPRINPPQRMSGSGRSNLRLVMGANGVVGGEKQMPNYAPSMHAPSVPPPKLEPQLSDDDETILWVFLGMVPVGRLTKIGISWLLPSNGSPLPAREPAPTVQTIVQPVPKPPLPGTKLTPNPFGKTVPIPSNPPPTPR